MNSFPKGKSFGKWKTGFEHANLPVATKADEVDVIITW